MEEKSRYLQVITRFLLVIVGCLALVFALPWVYRLLSPFLFALWAASALHPVLCRLEQEISWKRQILVLWLLSLFGIMVTTLFFVLLPSFFGELWELGHNWEFYLAQGEAFWGRVQEKLTQLTGRDSLWAQAVQVGSEALKNGTATWLAVAFSGLTSWLLALPSFVLRFFVFLLGTYFLSCDFPKYLVFWESHGSVHWKKWVGEVKNSAVTALSGYVRAQLCLSGGVFFIMLGGFLALDLPFALVLAFVIALLDFIPMIGSGMVLLPWSGFAFFMVEGRLWMWLVGIWLGTALFRYLLEPKILGKQTGMSPLFSLLSLYVGLQIWGVWGMILSPVLLLVVLKLCSIGLFAGLFQDFKFCCRGILGLFPGS